MRLDGAPAWSVRRELWENRSVYVAPLAAALIFLFGHLLSLTAGPPRQGAFVEPFTFASLVMMIVGVVVGVFYCLDAFYSERKDRSILFWKSLPVSDGTTVLSKAMVPLLVLPLFTTAATIVVHLVMLLMSSAALMMQGLTVTALWQEVAPLAMAVELLYHMVIIHVLWYAPIFAWLLLSSAWARRAPFLWAGIPILAIAVVEELVLGSTRFLDSLNYRLVNGPMNAAGSSDPMAHVNPAAYLGSPHFWIGLAVAALFLALAARVRRRSGPT
ncbi:MAG: ABC transporter permease [Gemmatimonadaceae bacterium]